MHAGQKDAVGLQQHGNCMQHANLRWQTIASQRWKHSKEQAERKGGPTIPAASRLLKNKRHKQHKLQEVETKIKAESGTENVNETQQERRRQNFCTPKFTPLASKEAAAAAAAAATAAATTSVAQRLRSRQNSTLLNERLLN
jgi:hypothetical protein